MFIARRIAAALLLPTLAVAAPATQRDLSAGAAPAPPLPMIAVTSRSLRCESAIKNGVQYLVQHQLPDGSWSDVLPRDVEGGQTAVVTLALLSSGMSAQSEPLAKALAFLRKAAPTRTYSVALRACVYAQLPEAARSPELRADVKWLQKAMITAAPATGMYTYGMHATSMDGDYSNSQYGVLGVWYAAEAGVEIPNRFWRLAEQGWLKGQQPDGGWGYTLWDNSPYASMTAAGAATLFITNDFLHTADTVDLYRHDTNAPLDRALAWLDQHFAADHNPGLDSPLNRERRDRGSVSGALAGSWLGRFDQKPGAYVPYMLFGYERVGEASGFTRFGTHRWFDEGTDFLTRTQLADGSWPATGNCSGSSEVETAYALLFLSRGRSPVAIQKLEFGKRWNNRPRDVADFISYLRYNTESHLNWQVVDIGAPASDLRDAPILYAASDRAIALTEAEKANLRNYILRGGVLLAVNEGDSVAFGSSVEALGVELFPGQSFHPVRPGDPLYTGNFRTTSEPIPLRELGNGVRPFIVLCPGDDLSWKWEVAGGALTEHLNPYTAAANLWHETVGAGDPLTKGQSTWFDRNVMTAESTRQLHLVRLQFNGNWDPEPAGWERLANLLHNSGDAELQVETRPIAALTSEDQIADLTAVGDVVLKPAEIIALQKFIDGGGLLIFDAAGGSAEAAASVQATLASLYPGARNEPLPIDHPIYLGQFPGGRPVDSVSYRASPDLVATHLPRLRGLTRNGRLLAIISDEDISGGLVGYLGGSFPGYSPSSAAELMRAILLWNASRQPNKPHTR